MSSKKLFSKVSSKKVAQPANTINNAGGVAYSVSDKAALAQLAMTGCFNSTYYVSDQDQLNKTLQLAVKLDPEYVAKLAVHSRSKGLMKDMPAVLTAVVASKNTELLGKVFTKVIDSPKMLRNFVQVIRSGVTGRKSLGTRPKKLIQNYLNNLSDDQLFKADVGNDPSLQDIIKLVHPRASSKERNALYAYLLDKDYNKEDLSELVKEFESFKTSLKEGKSVTKVPDVPFQMLTALPLTDSHWKEIARNATWNQIRMNLNTFERHGVFKDSALTALLAEKLANPDQVRRAKVFPYQLFTTFLNIDSSIPTSISIALQKAAEVSLENIPAFEGNVYVMVDTSGSMSSPATGNRGSVTTKTRCIDVAALVAAAVMRKNPNTQVIPFDTRVHQHKLNPLDSIMTNAKTLASFGGGGTNCAAALEHLNAKRAKGDLVIYVSDNESWMDNNKYGYANARATGMMNAWLEFKKSNKDAKLVCIDITPNTTTQAYDRDDILNIGGFSDQAFEVIAQFMKLGNNKDLWIKAIESTEI